MTARAFAASLASALLMSLALRLGLWPIGLVALVPLLLAVRRLHPGAAFACGWLAGLGVNLYGFAWAVAALGRFAGLAPLPAIGGLVVMCAYQALSLGIVTGGVALLADRARLPVVVTAPLLVVLAESALPLVFPWYLGILVWRGWPLLQVAELGGPAAVSALVMLVNATIAEAVVALARRERPPRRVLLAAALTGCVIALGMARAGHVAWVRAQSRHLRVGLVQPNFGIVSVEERSRRGQELIEVMRAQTDELGRRGAELVVWPESSFPFLFDRRLEREFAPGHPWALRASFRGPLLVGALTHGFGGSDVYNSAVLVAPDGHLAGRYDKVRLMPLGEYVPLSNRYPEWAERIRKQLPESPAIVPGPGAAVLETEGIRVAPMICYEDILPETAVDIARRSPRANLLVTLANHAWFGTSLAPTEALALATFRSVELRRDLVRATNTGVSSIGDALGRIVVEGPLVEASVEPRAAPASIEGEVALIESASLGGHCIVGFPFACAAALLGAAVVGRRRPPAAALA